MSGCQICVYREHLKIGRDAVQWTFFMVDAIFNFYATENEAVMDQVQLAQYF